MSWLGRQIGHVKKSIVTPVPHVVYKRTAIRESPVVDRPGEKLRRTVVDEVVREAKKLD